MLSEDSFPSLKKSISTLNNDPIIPKPMMRYSDVLKQKKTTTIKNSLKFNISKETKNDHKTDTLINSISEKTEKLSLNYSKSPVSPVSSPKTKTQPQNNNVNKNNRNNNTNINSIKINEEEIQKKYQKNIDNIVKIQAWWRIVSKVKSVKDITKNKKEDNIKEDNKIEDNKVKEIKKEENKEQENENEKKNEEKKEPVKVKKLSKKPSFSDIVKLTPPPSPVTTEKPSSPKKSIKVSKKVNNNNNNNNNNNTNNNNSNDNNRENKSNSKGNEKKNQNKKVNEELNSILKNMKFMGLIEKEIDDLTEKNTIVNGKQFAKTKVVTIKKFSRSNSSSSNFCIDDLKGAGDSKKKGNNNKNENKSNLKKVTKKKNVSFNEKDEVFNEYNHVMKKLDLHLRCDKKSCLIDCYRRLYKRDWEVDEETVSEESSYSGEEITEPSPAISKKSDYLYNDIYNPNYTKYYSGSDFDFGNRYFTGKERLKKALHLEPVEVTVQKIIYQPIKYRKQNNRNQQQKKKNGGKRKQK